MDGLSNNIGEEGGILLPFLGASYQILQDQGVSHRVSLPKAFAEALGNERDVRILPDIQSGRLRCFPGTSVSGAIFGDLLPKMSITKGDRITCPVSMQPILLQNNPGGGLVCVGCWDHFEIWNQQSWNKERKRRLPLVKEMGLLIDLKSSDCEIVDHSVDSRSRISLPEAFLVDNSSDTSLVVVRPGLDRGVLQIMYWSDMYERLLSLDVAKQREVACSVSFIKRQDRRVVVPSLNKTLLPGGVAFCLVYDGLVEVFSSKEQRSRALTTHPSVRGQNPQGPLSGGVSGAPSLE